MVNFHLVVGHVEGDIRHVQKIVGKILLDDVALVAAANDEFIHAVSGIQFHDMPQDRLATDLDHGFGF